MKTETQTLTCTHIITGDGQYLTDHHNREKEILIFSTPQETKEELIEELVNSAFNSDRLPDFISDKEVVNAISKTVNWLTSEDCYPSYYREELEKTEESGFCIDGEINVYCCLSWY